MLNVLKVVATTKAIETIVEKGMEKAINAATSAASDEIERIKIDFEIAFKKYEVKAYDKYSKAKTIIFGSNKVPLYDFFEVPNIETPSHEIISANGISDILDIDNYIILKGTGGMGKSTLMQHLFLSAFEGGDNIPIFLELKELNIRGDDYKLFDVIMDTINNMGGTFNKNSLEYALKAGCFVFLLDGYDEILSSKQAYFLKALSGFCDKYDENSFILSSRPTSDFVEFKRFTVIKCKKLTRKQAISMVQKLNYDEKVKSKFLCELESRLFRTHASFASNPLLLTIMLMTFTDYSNIPAKIHLFYAQAYETMFSRHDATKGGYTREVQCKLSEDEFKKVLSTFCFVSYVSNKFEFNIEELDDCLSYTHRVCSISFDSRKLKKDLIDHVCILYKDGNNYKFTHRSFQEYFTALFLKELDDDKMRDISMKMISADINRSTSDTVFSLLYDMCEDRFEKNILLPLLDRLEQERGEEDEYDFYFRNLVKHINTVYYHPTEECYDDLYLEWDDYEECDFSITTESDINEDDFEEGETGLKATIIFNESLLRYELSFIYYVCGDYLDMDTVEGNDEYVVDYLESRYDPVEMIQKGLDYDEIVADSELYNLLKKSWIGIFIEKLSKMYNEIQEKNNTSSDILFGLFKNKE